MPEGPLGVLPRPLASGNVVLLTTVDNQSLGDRTTQLESAIRNQSSVLINGVEFDPDTSTFGIVTGLDAIELNNLVQLSEDVEGIIGESSVKGHSVGFR